MSKKLKYKILGFASGILNGLLGAGGGMIIVPTLNKNGIDMKKSHATSVAIIFFTCLVSAIFYLSSEKVKIGDAVPYLFWGLIGSLVGSLLLKKMSDIWLHRAFGIFILWAAYRMIMS